MITKQQALEFIYDLSQKTEVMLDVSCGEIQFNRICDGDYLYTTFSELSTFESVVTKCIKENMEAIECLGVKQIPVDIGMLEVGQTYKVHVQHDWEHRAFTEKFLGFDEEDDYILRFENSKCNKSKPAEVSKYDIREIYKVNSNE